MPCNPAPKLAKMLRHSQKPSIGLANPAALFYVGALLIGPACAQSPEPAPTDGLPTATQTQSESTDEITSTPEHTETAATISTPRPTSSPSPAQTFAPTHTVPITTEAPSESPSPTTSSPGDGTPINTPSPHVETPTVTQIHTRSPSPAYATTPQNTADPTSMITPLNTPTSSPEPTPATTPTVIHDLTPTSPQTTAPVASPPPESPLFSPRVLTDKGAIEGHEDREDTWAFLGIPFAAPPSGDLRWKAPQAPEPWDDTLIADEFALQCPQIERRDDDGDGESEDHASGTEDCLYLNVWRPQEKREEPLPIMVFIHGGGNIQGTANKDYLHGPALAAKGDVIVVSIQYRLNIFGYMKHEALATGQDETDSGNFAQLDVIQALEWVQANGAQFGGDVDRVTVFGESAGAVNTWSMILSPLATGLFHGAIIESGCNSSRTVEDAEAHAQSLIESMVVEEGLTSEEEASEYLELQGDSWVSSYLHGKSSDEILTLIIAQGGLSMNEFKPARDGVVIAGGEEQDFIDGEYNRVPMIVGANADEQKLFYAHLAAMSQVQYQTYMSLLFGESVDEIEALYPRENYSPATPYNQFTDILDLSFELLCADYLSWVVSPHQETWLYHFQFDDLVEPFDYIYGAAHGLELPFVFSSLDSDLYPAEAQDARQTLSDHMIHYWSCMAHTGDPNCEKADGIEAPLWRAIDGESRDGFRRMVLDIEMREEVLPDINIERIDYWSDYYDLSYPPLLFDGP